MRIAGPLALALALILPGCGGGDTDTGAGSQLPSVGGGGTLTVALAELPGSLDPVHASSPAAQLVSRQIHEPLVASTSPPYEDDPQPSGLAVSVEPSADGTVWTAVLRRGVRFQDGSPFNAAAVLANARRWSSLPAGRALLPSLFAVDAPRPNEVRFQFQRPFGRLPARLGSARLGIVSPNALRPSAGERARFREGASGTGTGAFELATRSDSVLELARRAPWWGSSAGLGPALDALAFVAEPDARERSALLGSGEAQIAQPLGGGDVAEATEDPLVTEVRIGGRTAGIEASVRGLEAGSVVPALSSVWLTRIGT